MSNANLVSDHANRQEFVDYYAEKSTRPETIKHFRSIQAAILRVLKSFHPGEQAFDVLDVGCNAGTQCMLWSEIGHRVHGLDISQPLLQLAEERAIDNGRTIEYRLGTATALPWVNESMDVCIALELLEHVEDWRTCLKEFIRVLRPRGVLFLTTTNAMCPRQDEFNLPAYSWYPAPLKRHFERLAMTIRPELANHAKYPAVNWFSPYGLKAELRADGFSCLDRFDLVDLSKKGPSTRLLVHAIRAVPLLRLIGYLCTNGTMVLGVKSGRNHL